jgi:hypothetical protein
MLQAIQDSKSARRYLKKYNDMCLSAESLPTANALDNAESDEAKTYKRLASAILRLANRSWWENAPKSDEFDNIINFARMCKNNGIEISILSSPFEEESIEGKLEWCRAHLEPLCIFSRFHIRRDKDTFASSSSMLLDDRAKVCSNFKGNGHSVLFDSLWEANALSVINNNDITHMYIDLDGVLVNTHKHIMQIMKSL